MNIIVSNVLITLEIISIIFLISALYVYYKKLMDINLRRRIRVGRKYHIELIDCSDKLIGVLEDLSGKKIDDISKIEYTITHYYLVGSNNYYIVNRITSIMNVTKNYNDIPANIRIRLDNYNNTSK